LIPQLMINYMIAKTGGADSIYFVGLTYALTGLGVFFPLTLVEASTFAGATLIMYAVACVEGARGSVFTNTFFGNLTFLGFFVVVMLVVSVYGERWRRQSFNLQQETKAREVALAESNRALTEAKLQLVQSEKMASLGTLSAGLLHELNNPINYSGIAIKLTREYLEAGDLVSAQDVTNDAMVGIDRVKAIILDLKTFAYQKADLESPLRNRFNLLEAVRVAGRLTAHERLGYQFDIEIPERLWVKGDAAAISSVFINLLSNSGLALDQAKRGKDGRIVVKALQGTVQGTVAVSVYDNGVGISVANLRRVFEPFYTTKTVGKGLGMGLSISYAIVQRHGSLLSVKSLEGEYTEFNFELQGDIDEFQA
jgi:two-component system, sensor histidine kinase PhcS